MTKAGQFIEDCTRNCSNVCSFNSLECEIPWLTPDQARRAVEIERTEIYEWLRNHYRDYMHNPTGKKLEAFFGIDMCNDLEKAMKDE